MPQDLDIDFIPVLSYTFGNTAGNVTGIVIIVPSNSGMNFNQDDSKW